MARLGTRGGSPASACSIARLVPRTKKSARGLARNRIRFSECHWREPPHTTASVSVTEQRVCVRPAGSRACDPTDVARRRSARTRAPIVEWTSCKYRALADLRDVPCLANKMRSPPRHILAHQSLAPSHLITSILRSCERMRTNVPDTKHRRDAILEAVTRPHTPSPDTVHELSMLKIHPAMSCSILS